MLVFNFRVLLRKTWKLSIFLVLDIYLGFDLFEGVRLVIVLKNMIIEILEGARLHFLHFCKIFETIEIRMCLCSIF